MRWSSAHVLHLGRGSLTLVLLLTLVLQLAAGVGLAWVAGFGAVRSAILQFAWPWLPAIIGGLLVSFLGYYHAYRGTFATSPHWSLPQRQLLPVAVAGFGGFLACGATDIDVAALEAGTANRAR